MKLVVNTQKLWDAYLEHVFAYLANRQLLREGIPTNPDEVFMRAIEVAGEIPEVAADDFRREVAIKYAIKSFDKMEFPCSACSHERLYKAVMARAKALQQSL